MLHPLKRICITHYVDYNPAGEEHLLKHLEVLTKDHIISPFSFLLSNGGFIEITSLFMNNVNT